MSVFLVKMKIWPIFEVLWKLRIIDQTWYKNPAKNVAGDMELFPACRERGHSFDSLWHLTHQSRWLTNEFSEPTYHHHNLNLNFYHNRNSYLNANPKSSPQMGVGYGAAVKLSARKTEGYEAIRTARWPPDLIRWPTRSTAK